MAVQTSRGITLKSHVSLILALLTAPAFADAPATGLDALAPLLPGTWKTVGQTFDSQFTKAGPQGYTTVRDCWRKGAEFKCVFVVNGQLQLFEIFSWDPVDGVYHETQITPQGKQPDFHIMVKGAVWTYDQDIETKDGKVVHYRIVRTYTEPASADYLYEYSIDGKEWTPIAKGVETRID